MRENWKSDALFPILTGWGGGGGQLSHPINMLGTHSGIWMIPLDEGSADDEKYERKTVYSFHAVSS